MHENMKTSMWHTGRSERTCRLPACFSYITPDTANFVLDSQIFVAMATRVKGAAQI